LNRAPPRSGGRRQFWRLTALPGAHSYKCCPWDAAWTAVLSLPVPRSSTPR